MIETFEIIFKTVWSWIVYPLFAIGTQPVSFLAIFKLVLFVSLLFYLSRQFNKRLVDRLLKKQGLDLGHRQALTKIIHYLVVSVGLLVITQSIGFDLTALSVFAGAIGVGIGFGLQNIANNIISGIILLIERPIKVSDRVELGGRHGDVMEIGLRATNIRTNENVSILIPNSEFINSQVINWSHNDRNIRFDIPIGVSYATEPAKVRELLLEIADENPDVLKHPPPDVIFEAYGESSLDFRLRIWTNRLLTKPLDLRSQINFAISEKFRKHDIEIPYPQRDIHIKSGLEFKPKIKETSAKDRLGDS